MNTKQITALFAVCVFASSLSQAATVSWDGGAGNWDDTNWTVDGTPGQFPTIADASGKTKDTYTIGSGTVTRSRGLTLGNPGGRFTLGSGAIYNTAGFLNFAPNSSGLLQGTVSGTAQLTSGETTGAVVIDGGFLSFSYVSVGAVGGKIVAASGALEVTSNNGFRFGKGANLDGGALIDFTGGGGSFTITQGNNSSSGKELASKARAGFFGINGTQVKTATVYDGTNLATVNSELKAAAVDGRYFQVTENAGTQTLSIVSD